MIVEKGNFDLIGQGEAIFGALGEKGGSSRSNFYWLCYLFRFSDHGESIFPGGRMSHALNPDPQGGGDADLCRWIQAAAMQMDNIAEFQLLAAATLKRVRATGLEFYALSIHLFESPTTALHYTFAEGEASWLQQEVTEELAEYKVYADKEAHSWQSTQSDRAVAYLSVPTVTGVATKRRGRGGCLPTGRSSNGLRRTSFSTATIRRSPRKPRAARG